MFAALMKYFGGPSPGVKKPAESDAESSSDEAVGTAEEPPTKRQRLHEQAETEEDDVRAVALWSPVKRSAPQVGSPVPPVDRVLFADSADSSDAGHGLGGEFFEIPPPSPSTSGVESGSTSPLEEDGDAHLLVGDLHPGKDFYERCEELDRELEAACSASDVAAVFVHRASTAHAERKKRSMAEALLS
jgi:hypothetical protein